MSSKDVGSSSWMTLEIWTRFMGPGLIPSGRISDALDIKMMKWPGHGVGKDVTMQQIVENEYMKADEYDWQMMDPTDYALRVALPRSAGVFEPFAKMPPVRTFFGPAGWVGFLANPGYAKSSKTLMDLGDEFFTSSKRPSWK